MSPEVVSEQTPGFRWLTADEQLSWRSYVSAQLLLQERLERDIKASHGLSMAEYEIMVRLSEAPDRRLRMTELANRTLASKSRLSHQVARMEADGILRREECPSDRRGTLAVLTDRGFELLVAAAPSHVQSVRTLFVESLEPDELAALGAACQKVVDRLREAACEPPTALPAD